MTKLTGFTSTEEMELFLFEEVKRNARRSTASSFHNADDLESYLMVSVWNFVTKNEKYQTQKGIRQVIKTRTLDFYKSPKQNPDHLTFSALGSQDDEGSETDFESTFNSGDVTIDATIVDAELLNGFLASLNDRQRLIVELRAGIISSLDSEQMRTFEEIISKQQSTKKAGEVYLSNSDIAKIVGIHRNHITKNLNAISEKALDFGLEELV